MTKSELTSQFAHRAGRKGGMIPGPERFQVILDYVGGDFVVMAVIDELAKLLQLIVLHVAKTQTP